jgi:pyoverdine/dityrosine biosynthesis protein Dit1
VVDEVVVLVWKDLIDLVDKLRTRVGAVCVVDVVVGFLELNDEIADGGDVSEFDGVELA